MDCKECNNLLREHITGELNIYQLDQLKKHLKECPACQDLYNDLLKINAAFESIPDLDLLDEAADFQQIIQAEARKSKQDKTLKIPPYVTIPVSIAASILIFFGGYFLGNRENSEAVNNEKLTALKQEVAKTKNLMILTLLNQQSASKRIQAVNYAAELDQLQPEVMQALLNSLSHDNSTNVRLATLETLAQYAGDPVVRLELVKALENQEDPVIQLNMINLMVLINEKSSAGALLKLVENENTPASVKDRAEKGLEVLL
jgi:predicted anti-sigma-YlaC factor YlaD